MNKELSAAGLPTLDLTPETYSDALSELLNILNNMGLNGSEAYQNIAATKNQLDGYNTFYHGIGQYLSGVNDAASGSYDLQSGLNQLLDSTGQLQTGMNEFCDGIRELEDGGDALLDGTIELSDGVVELCDGVVELKDGTIELLDGAIELYDGTVELHDGVIELKDGTFEFRDKTSKLDDDLKDEINEAIKEMVGSDFKAVSFVSEKNTNVDSVQFVIQTKAISIEEMVEEDGGEEIMLTFWQKLLRLFGLYKG